MNKHAGILIFLVVLTLSACGGSSNSKSMKGVKITVLSVERMSEFREGMDRWHASSPEDEVAVVNVEFKAIHKEIDLKLNHSEMILIDSLGNKNMANFDLSFNNIQKPINWKITFAVKKHIGLSKLRLGEAEFDLNSKYFEKKN
jgi:hypothetical protein